MCMCRISLCGADVTCSKHGMGPAWPLLGGDGTKETHIGITLPFMDRKSASNQTPKSVLGCHFSQVELLHQQWDASADLHCGVCESVNMLLTASDHACSS